MSVLFYKITEAHEGASIKTYLRQQLRLSARTVIRLKNGGIAVNGKLEYVTALLHTGDLLELTVAEVPEKHYQPEDIPLHFHYADDYFLVLDKPAGMPVYPVGRHHSGSLLNAVAFHCPEITFRPLYRLDRNTSGIMVIAKSRLSASSVRLTKSYYAVCQGVPPESGAVSTPIGLAANSKIKRITGTGQTALTHFVRLRSGGGHSLLELRLETGRTHQIRVHMASIGFPLAGDDLYGSSLAFLQRHALHCGAVHLAAESTGIDHHFRSELPKDITTAFPDLF